MPKSHIICDPAYVLSLRMGTKRGAQGQFFRALSFLCFYLYTIMHQLLGDLLIVKVQSTPINSTVSPASRYVIVSVLSASCVHHVRGVALSRRNLPQ